MGDISFLTGGNPASPQSVEESIYQLENTSVVFLSAWLRTPRDFRRAARASQEAMLHLDHIVNEILRARDSLKSNNSYIGSALETQLNIDSAVSVDQVTRQQQLSLTTLGPGNGVLPSAGTPLKMERLLNKIKHRRHDLANFRVGSTGEHIFLIAVDTPKQQPDSIVEFIVGDFCQYCGNIAQII